MSRFAWCLVAVQTGARIGKFLEHALVLQSFSFNGDKSLLITASADMTAKVCG